VLMQNVSVVKKIDYSLNSELKKLQFFGAGPKTALPDTLVRAETGYPSPFTGLSSLFVLLAAHVSPVHW